MGKTVTLKRTDNSQKNGLTKNSRITSRVNVKQAQFGGDHTPYNMCFLGKMWRMRNQKNWFNLLGDNSVSTAWFLERLQQVKKYRKNKTKFKKFIKLKKFFGKTFNNILEIWAGLRNALSRIFCFFKSSSPHWAIFLVDFPLSLLIFSAYTNHVFASKATVAAAKKTSMKMKGDKKDLRKNKIKLSRWM